MKLTILSDECIPNCRFGVKCGRCTEVFGSDIGKYADVSIVTQSLDARGEPYRVEISRPAAGRHKTVHVLVDPVFGSQFREYPVPKKAGKCKSSS